MTTAMPSRPDNLDQSDDPHGTQCQCCVDQFAVVVAPAFTPSGIKMDVPQCADCYQPPETIRGYDEDRHGVFEMTRSDLIVSPADDLAVLRGSQRIREFQIQHGPGKCSYITPYGDPDDSYLVVPDHE